MLVTKELRSVNTDMTWEWVNDDIIDSFGWTIPWMLFNFTTWWQQLAILVKGENRVIEDTWLCKYRDKAGYQNLELTRIHSGV